MVLSALYNLVARLYHFIDDSRYRTRIKLLIARGLVIGKNVTISANAVIDTGYPYLIRIGDNSSIAEHVRILAHDAATFKFTGGLTRLGMVDIKENCFIGDRSTILPGVTIGPNALVVAGSVVSRDIPPNSCAAGHPARVYSKFDEYINRNLEQIENGSVFAFSDLMDNVDSLDSSTKAKVWESVQDGRHAYVKGFTGRNPYTWNVDA
jgi:acetyltransferase-like isoleucine patch superfamily enzyme